MGCCLWFTKDKHFNNSLEKNIKELNRITNSRYFYERSKIKMKFTLMSKRKIKVTIYKQIIKITPNIEENIITVGENEHKHPENNPNKKVNDALDKAEKPKSADAHVTNNNNLSSKTVIIKNENNNFKNNNNNSDACSEYSYTKRGGECDVFELRTFFIEPTAFYHFYNKVQNCNILFKKRESNKLSPLESDYSEKNKLDDSVELYKCCICFDNTNDILLDCAHKFCENCIKDWCRRNSSHTCPMCRDKITAREKSPGVIDLEHYKWSVIDEKEFFKGRNGYLRELDEIFVEAMKNLLDE